MGKEAVQAAEPQLEEEFQESQSEENEFDSEDELNEDEKLLKKIQDEIVEVDNPLKLSWAAIYNLKTQEQILLEKMDGEMKIIQDKYDKLREPISIQIAKIASGHPIDRSLYAQNQHIKDINPNKHKPQAIPGYWATVFKNSAFIDTQIDQNIMQSCTKVKCEKIVNKSDSEDEETITIEFTFKENPYFTNEVVNLSMKRKGQDYEKLNIDELQLKGEKDQSSLIMTLFDSESVLRPVYECAQDIDRTYKNSLFFYFHEGEDEDDEEADDQEEESDDQEENEDDDEEEDDEKQSDERPKKRKKMI